MPSHEETRRNITMNILQCEFCKSLLPDSARFCECCGRETQASTAATAIASITPILQLPALDKRTTTRFIASNIPTHVDPSPGKRVRHDNDAPPIHSNEGIQEIERQPTI